jgi:hypothetical protein
MRFATIAAIAILGSAVAAPAAFAADAPAAPAAAKLSTGETSLGDLLDNAAAKAVLEKNAPMLTAGGQIDQARPMTIKSLQQYIPTLTDELLAKIDAELAAIK